MAELSGKWLFCETIMLPAVDMEQAVNFTTEKTIDDVFYTMNCSAMMLEVSNGEPLKYKLESTVPESDYRVRWEAAYLNAPSMETVCFYEEVLRAVDFGDEAQLVSDEFYAWFAANAAQQDIATPDAPTEPESPAETPAATITHNGEVIASMFSGKSATLKCAGMKMTGDVVVTVTKQQGDGGAELLDGFSVTENGTYDLFYGNASFTWGKDTLYDGTVSIDEDMTLRYKKVTDFIVPDDVTCLNDPNCSLTTSVPGGVIDDLPDGAVEVIPLNMLDPTDLENGVYLLYSIPYLVMWVKDASTINTTYGCNFEDNAVYVTDFLWQDDESMSAVTLTLTAPGRQFDGVSSVTVDVLPELYSKDVTLTENGTTEVLPYENTDGLSKVVVNVSCDMQKELRPVLDGSVTELFCTGLSDIRPYAFRGCSNLETVTLNGLGNGTIGDYAFDGCTKLTAVNRYAGGEILPNNIYFTYQLRPNAFSKCGISGPLKIRGCQVMSESFKGCTALTSVDILLQGPLSPKYVQLEAFANCTALKTVRVSCDDTRNDDYRPYIWLQAFTGCTNLVSLTLDYPMVMKTLENDISYLPENLQTIYVPADVVGAYQTDAVWGAVADKISPIPEEEV